MIENLTIKQVTKSDNGWSISTNESTCFFLDKSSLPYTDIEPKEGDSIELHCVNGSKIRGVVLNGIELYYKTDKQLEEEYKKYCDDLETKRQQEFEESKEQLDSDYNSLPECFQKRIDRFRTNNPNFRVEYEAYEMFCCKEAIKIAEALKTVEKLQEFNKAPYDEQIKILPTIADSHSGNTFSCSCRLAYHYLTEKENVAKEHGALSTLVGSEAYGDFPKEK